MELPINIQIECTEVVPTYAHYGDGGADLRSTTDTTIRPGEVILVPTGVQVEIPYGYAGFLMSRSGQGKLKVSLANSVGLIDHQYRGQIYAQITNEGTEEYRIKQFDRIAQLVIVPIVNTIFNVVAQVSETTRGSGGFGSSGVK